MIFHPRRTLACLVLSAGLCGFAPAQQQVQPQPVQPWKQIPIPPLHAFHPQQPRRVQLANGMILFLQEDHELPLIDGFAVIRGGSRSEPANKIGLVELYGDTWRTGGTETMTGDQMDEFLEARAAKIETNGDIDSTNIGWSCLKGDFDQVFPLFVDLLRRPAFRADKLELAKQEAATSIARRNDSLGAIASREAVQLAYGQNSPYARIPEYATIAAVSREDLVAWHREHTLPNNIIMGVVGDFDAAQMEARLRRAFEPWPKGPAFQKPAIPIDPPKPGYYFVRKEDVNQSAIRMVALGTERSNPDYYALQVMNEIFAGGFSSRLFNDIRTRLGLAYSVGGAYGASFDHPGVFYIAAGTKSATTVETIQAMLKDVDSLRIVPPTDEELRRAKDDVLNAFIFHYDSPDKILREQVNLEFYGYPQDFLERYRTGVEKVTVADVARVAQKYVHPQQLRILVVGNPAEFHEQLSSLGPVTTLDIAIPEPPGSAAGQPAAAAPVQRGTAQGASTH